MGVCVERTANAVAALLGTLKTGAAYLPLDPAYPADRLRTMIEDSGAKLVIAHRSLQSLTENQAPPPQMRKKKKRFEQKRFKQKKI